MKGFELEKDNSVEVVEAEVVSQKPSTNEKPELTTRQVLGRAAAQNFDKILDLAGGIVEIKRMEVASQAVIAKMEADRKLLMTEAETYVMKKNSDTNSIVERMNVIRLFMQDFYQQSNRQITSEDFRIIITEVVNQMGRVNNE